MKSWLKTVSIVFWLIVSIVLLLWQNVDAWWFDGDSTTMLLDSVVDKANDPTEEVQNTRLDGIVTSRWNACWQDSRYTFSNTLCIIRDNLYSYLQYAVYIWLAVATILLVRNGFTLVVSKDNEAQFKKVIKNMMNIGIWVLLLLGFYIILEIFVSIVNLIVE